MKPPSHLVTNLILILLLLLTTRTTQAQPAISGFVPNFRKPLGGDWQIPDRSPKIWDVPAISVEIRPGFDAFYKVQTWTPVRVMIANQGTDLPQAELRLYSSGGYSAANILYTYPVDLPAQSRKQLTLHVPIRNQERRLKLELVDQAGQVLLAQESQVEPLAAEDYLVGVVATDPSLLNGLAGLTAAGGNRITVAHLELADLPATVQAWSGLDMLVFNGVDTSPLSPAQQEALQSWVRFGGRLVVGGGPTAPQTIAGLKSLLPLAKVTIHTLPHPLADLQEFVTTPLEDRGPYLAAVPTAVTGRVLLQEGNLPLAVTLELGLGQVYYLALDLSLAPLDTLAAKPQFLPRLTGQFQPQNDLLTNNGNWNNMRQSLALIPDQALPTPGRVALYLLIYVLVMGPVNYLVLRRLKRREWAWFSIPAIILLFSSYGYVAGFRLRGGAPLVRQIAVVKAEPGAPLAPVTTFIGVYSPYRATYNLEVAGAALVESLYDPSGSNNELTVAAGEATLVENLQGDIGGLPAVVVHSHTTPPQITAELRYDRAAGQVSGRLNNNTGQPISHAYLLVEDTGSNLYVADLATLPPGETKINQPVSQQSNYAFSPYYDVNSLYQNRDQVGDPREQIELASREITVETMLGLNRSVRPPFTRANLVYLIGWQEESPVTVTLMDGRSDQLSDTLLLVGLPLASN